MHKHFCVKTMLRFGRTDADDGPASIPAIIFYISPPALGGLVASCPLFCTVHANTILMHFYSFTVKTCISSQMLLLANYFF